MKILFEFIQQKPLYALVITLSKTEINCYQTYAISDKDK